MNAPGDKVSFDPEQPYVETTCMCGAIVIAGSMTNGQQAVIHKQPMCPEFDRLEPQDFLVWLRTKKEEGGHA